MGTVSSCDLSGCDMDGEAPRVSCPHNLGMMAPPDILNWVHSPTAIMRLKRAMLDSRSATSDSNLPSPAVLTPVQPHSSGRKRAASEDDAWGFFEDLELVMDDHDQAGGPSAFSPLNCSQAYPISLEAPGYILEDTGLGTQALWYATAGQRPQQPASEREHYERLWEANFQQSQVDYRAALPSPTKAVAPLSKRQRRPSTVLSKGYSPCRSMASKAFCCPECGCCAQLMVYISQYRIVEDSDGYDQHAEFLVVVNVGELAFAVWKRFRDFKRLADRLGADPVWRKQFRGSMATWQSVTQRQRWHRCLERDYLSFKCLLLQRFLHSVVFESNRPSPLREFVGFS